VTARPPRDPGEGAPQARYPGDGTWGWALGVAGLVGLGASALGDPGAARAAAAQDWPPFALVTGLLLVGLVADQDGLFARAGAALGRAGSHALVLYGGAVVLVAAVTAVLNLDTSVAFLTPVLVYAGRRTRRAEGALLYGCVLLSNAASLLLPGSNLTNLIVLGHLHLSGARLVGHLAPAWAVSVLCTAGVVAWGERAGLRARRAGPAPAPRPEHRPGAPRPAGSGPALLGTAAVAAVTALVLVLGDPALPVAAVGAVAAGARLAARRLTGRRVLGVLGAPVLAGLFGVAVSLGTLGRAWSGPSRALAHLGTWGGAALGALAGVAVNNLPAASLLAARPPARPLALLVGLDIGPNLFVTGSLAWFLWQRAALSAGVRPSLGRATRLGLVSAPVAMAAALATLALSGAH